MKQLDSMKVPWWESTSQNLSFSSYPGKLARLLGLVVALGVVSGATIRSDPEMGGSIHESPTFVVSTNVEFIPISGLNTLELHDALLAVGPADAHGIKRYAEVHWRLNWNVKSSNGPRSLRAEVNMVLPWWKEFAIAHYDQQIRWTDFMGRLLRHETTHLAHLYSGLQQIYGELSHALPGAESATEEKIQTIIDSMRARDKQYDIETRHGETEGIDLTAARTEQEKPS